jgi:hypothetical protein
VRSEKKQSLAIANGSTACMAFLEATSKFNINFSGENKKFLCVMESFNNEKSLL